MHHVKEKRGNKVGEKLAKRVENERTNEQANLLGWNSLKQNKGDRNYPNFGRNKKESDNRKDFNNERCKERVSLHYNQL